MPDIFKYTDLTTYLKAVYKEMNQQAIYSYRTISTYFDINLGLLHGMFNGNNKITERFLPKFIEILELKGKKKEYFQQLVYISQAEMPKKLKKKLIKLLNVRPDKKVHI